MSQSSWDKRYTSLRDDWENSWIQWTKFSFDTSASIELVNRRIADQENFSKEIALKSIKAAYDWQNIKSPDILRNVESPLRCIFSDKRQPSPEIARKYIKSFDMVVSDESLSDMTGLEFVKKLVMTHPMTHCALVNSLSPETYHEASEGLGLLMQLPAAPDRETSEQLLSHLKTIINL